MKIRYRILIVLFTIHAFLSESVIVSVAQRSSTDNESSRQEFEKFIINHPFNKRDRLNSIDLKKIPKKDRPDLAWEQDFLKTLDPALGYPPTERLNTAYQKVQQFKTFKTPIPGMAWEERGPSNVGGRTRAIMFDPNDVTKKKVWAGGTTGGLWYNNDITNVSSTWTKVNDFWDNISISSIAYDPNNTLIFYVGSGEGWTASSSYPGSSTRGTGVWKTADGGTTWAQLSASTGYYYVMDLAVRNESGTSALYVAVDSRYYNGVWHGSQGLFRSINGGTSFTQVLPNIAGSPYTPADIEIGADNRLYIGSKRNSFGDGGATILYSDNGTTWTADSSYSSLASSGRIELACAPSNSNIIYGLIEANNKVEKVVKSINKGVSWSDIAKPVDGDAGIPSTDFSRGQGWYDLILAVDPNNENAVFTGAIDLFKTTNGGTSWTQISHWYGGFGFPEVHADQHAIVFQPASSTNIVFGNDGGIYFTSTGTSVTPTFSNRNSSYNVTQFYACAMSGTTGSNNFLSGAQDNGTQRFTTAGVNSTTEVRGGDGAFCFIDQDNPTYQISSYVYNTYDLSSNSGVTFITTLVDDETTGNFINPADYDDRENILYSGYSTTQILRIKSVTSTPSAPTPVSITGMSTEASHISVSPYSSVGTSTIFIGTETGKLFKVVNAHSTPTVTDITGASFPAGNISCVEIGVSESELLVTFSNYGVTSIWYSSNGGTSWVSKEGNLPDLPVRWALFNPNDRKQVLLATEVGVWSTTDISIASPDWDPTNSGLANVRVDMLQVRNSDKIVIAATHGRGVFSTNGFNISSIAPVVAFNANDTTICAGNSILFTDQSTNTPTSWSWTFSGGTPSTSTTQNPTITFSTAGIYTITLIATNAAGSDTLVKSGYVTVSSYPTVTVNPVSDTLCNGDTTILTASGASTYSWSPSAGLSNTTGSSVSAFSLTTTTYTVIGTNLSGCTDTTTVNIISNSPIVDITAASFAICPGDSTTLTASGASTYNWSPSTGLSSITGSNVKASPAIATTYIVTGLSSNGCSDTASITITLSTTGQSLPLAEGFEGVTFVPTGWALYNPNNNITWVRTTTVSGFGNSTASAKMDNYTDSIRGQIDVLYTPTLNLSSYSSALLTFDVAYASYSAIYSDTLIIYSSICGASYVPFWQKGNAALATAPNSTTAFTPTASQWRKDTIDLNSYVGNSSVRLAIVNLSGWGNNLYIDNVNVNGSASIPVADFSSNKTNLCQNNSVTFTNNSTGNITSYSWNFGADASPATASTVGPHSISYSSSGNKTITLIVSGSGGSDTLTKVNYIAVNSNPIASIISSNDVSCNSGNDGNASVSVTNGSLPYTYVWNTSPAQTSQNVVSIPAGTYTVSVSDVNGCQNNATVTINEPAALLVTINKTDTKCNTASGSATVNVSGGNGGYSFLWSNVSIDSVITGLQTGAYTVTVKDSKNCIATKSILINETDTLVLSAVIKDVSCNGVTDGAIDLAVSGGVSPYAYSWTNGSTTQDLTSLSGTSLTVTVVDVNGCIAEKNVSLNEPSAISIISTVTSDACSNNANGSATVTASGGTPGYTYSWSNGTTASTISGVIADTYTVTVLDSNGCQAQTAVTINDIGGPVAGISASANVSCNGGSNGTAAVTATGGTLPYTYKWNNSGTSASIGVLTAGTYTVTVIDANSCKVITSLTITEPAAIVLTTGLIHVSCNGDSNGAITITSSGGTGTYTYKWSNGATTSGLSNLTAGSYTLTIIDSNNCNAYSTYLINEPSELTLFINTVDVSFGNDGAASVSVSGGTPTYSYSWSNGSNTSDISGLAAGIYSVTVTDANGCTATAIATVGESDGYYESTIVKNIFLYPNPVNKELIIENNLTEVSKLNIIIYSCLGNIILKKYYLVDNQKLKLNLSSYKTGMYFIEIESEGNVILREKIVLINESN